MSAGRTRAAWRSSLTTRSSPRQPARSSSTGPTWRRGGPATAPRRPGPPRPSPSPPPRRRRGPDPAPGLAPGGSGEREDDRAVRGDGDGVLHVGGAAAVAGADGPAVVVGVAVVVAAGHEPRLDRDDQAGGELHALLRAAVVGDVRVLVHGPPDPVTSK